MIRNQDMSSSNNLLVCSSFSRVHAYLSTPKDLKKTLLERWKWSWKFSRAKKNPSNKHFPSSTAHPSVRQSGLRWNSRAPQQVGNHKTSPTSIKAQRSTRLELKSRSVFKDSIHDFYVHPWKLTWNPKMEVWKMIILFNWAVFRFHVKFQGCKWCFSGFFSSPKKQREKFLQIAKVTIYNIMGEPSQDLRMCRIQKLSIWWEHPCLMSEGTYTDTPQK